MDVPAAEHFPEAAFSLPDTAQCKSDVFAAQHSHIEVLESFESAMTFNILSDADREAVQPSVVNLGFQSAGQI